MIEEVILVIGELLLQVVLEVLVEFGLHSLKASTRRAPNPWMAALGYIMLGAICGGVSLLFLPTHLTPEGPLRTLNLLFSPAAAGLLMAALGKWRARRAEPLLRIDRFSYGYLFALALALVRHHFAA